MDKDYDQLLNLMILDIIDQQVGHLSQSILDTVEAYYGEIHSDEYNKIYKIMSKSYKRWRLDHE